MARLLRGRRVRVAGPRPGSVYYGYEGRIIKTERRRRSSVVDYCVKLDAPLVRWPIEVWFAQDEILPMEGEALR